MMTSKLSDLGVPYIIHVLYSDRLFTCRYIRICFVYIRIWRQNSVYKAPRFSIESQGFTEDQDKEKDKDSQDH